MGFEQDNNFDPRPAVAKFSASKAAKIQGATDYNLQEQHSYEKGFPQ